MATHSSVLAWKIPGTVEPDGLPSMGSHRVGHDWSDTAAAAGKWGDFLKITLDLNTKYTSYGEFFVFIWYLCMGQRRQWHPTPVLLPGKSHGQRSLVGSVCGVTKSQTPLSNVTFTFHFHVLEKEMATHSNVLAWRIPWTGEHILWLLFFPALLTYNWHAALHKFQVCRA